MSIEGIDISNHQGAVDWQKVAAAHKSFAFIKATQGDYFTDPYFARNRAGAKAAGLLVGAYHFFDPRTDAKKQAEYFCNVVGAIPKGELQPVLDFESLGATNGLNGPAVPRDQAIHAAVVWLTEVKNRTGRTPIIYTYVDFVRTDLQNTQRFKLDWPLWIAHYGVAQPTLVGGWSQYSFWQYTSNGACPGVNGVCDLDRFNGGLAQLCQFGGC